MKTTNSINAWYAYTDSYAVYIFAFSDADSLMWETRTDYREAGEILNCLSEPTTSEFLLDHYDFDNNTEEVNKEFERLENSDAECFLRWIKGDIIEESLQCYYNYDRDSTLAEYYAQSGVEELIDFCERTESEVEKVIEELSYATMQKLYNKESYEKLIRHICKTHFPGIENLESKARRITDLAEALPSIPDVTERFYNNPTEDNEEITEGNCYTHDYIELDFYSRSRGDHDIDEFIAYWLCPEGYQITDVELDGYYRSHRLEKQ